MTTIAYRDGIMAADTQVSDDNGFKTFQSQPKIAKDSAGVLYGVAGDYGAVCKVIEVIQRELEGTTPKLLPIPLKGDRFEIMIAYPDGRLRVLTPHGEENFDNQSFMAIGTGYKVALGAMFAGADAQLAVKAAIAYDQGSGGRVDHIWNDATVKSGNRPRTVNTQEIGRGVVYEPEAHPLANTPAWKRPEPLNISETPEQEFERIAREGF